MNKFDPEIQIRSWVLGAVALTLAKCLYGPTATVSDVDSSALGALLGAAYDFLAYNVKRRLADRKKPEG